MKIISREKFEAEFIGGGCADPDDYCPLDEFDARSVKTIPFFIEQKLDYDTFPKNIVEIYYYQVGVADNVDWILVCLLTNGVYAYFRAWCDYTGFICQGGTELILADSIENLQDYGMSGAVRKQFREFQGQEDN